MSNTPFVESSSSDPVERAIARKVQRILNDKTLDRQRRETLVHKAQRELIEHRRRQEQQQTLTQQVAALKLPQGFRAQSITVREDRVHVGALTASRPLSGLMPGKRPRAWRRISRHLPPAATPSAMAARFARAWSRQLPSAARRWVTTNLRWSTHDRPPPTTKSAASFPGNSNPSPQGTNP